LHEVSFPWFRTHAPARQPPRGHSESKWHGCAAAAAGIPVHVPIRQAPPRHSESTLQGISCLGGSNAASDPAGRGVVAQAARTMTVTSASPHPDSRITRRMARERTARPTQATSIGG